MTKDDLIYRQAAIKAMSESLKRVFPEHRQIAEKCLNVLPSAQEKPFNLPEIYIAEGYDTIEGEDGNVGFGVYVPDETKIYVAGDVDGEIRARALFHEVCHWVQAMCGRPFDEDEANEFSDIVYDALPSAQPEIIHCKDCRWWDKYNDYDNGYCMAAAKHGYFSKHWEINIMRTYRGNFYCADAEPKGEQA